MEAQKSDEKRRRDIIIFNVLPRLPAKSLIRFMCVCKSMSSLIRSPSVVAAYSKFRCNKPKNLLFESQCYEDIDEEQRGYFSSKIDQHGNPTPITCLSYIPSFYQESNVQSINGLILVSCDRSYRIHASVYICNPTTRQCITLRVPAFRESMWVTYHFGYCPLRNEYKVLQMLWNRNKETGQRHIMPNIFTLGTNFWRPLKVDFGHDLPISLQDWSFKRSVCLHGAIHWVHKEANIVLAFDVGEEKFRAIPLPDEDYNGDAHEDNDANEHNNAHECKEENYDDYDDSQKYDDYDDYDAHENYDDYDRYDYYDHAPIYRTTLEKGIVDVGGYVGVFSSKNMEKKQLVLWILKDYKNHEWIRETIQLRREFTSEGYINSDRGCHVDPLGTIGTGELAVAVQLSAYSPSGYGRGVPQLHLYNLQNKQCAIHEFERKEGENIWLRGIRLVTSYDDSIVPLK